MNYNAFLITENKVEKPEIISIHQTQKNVEYKLSKESFHNNISPKPSESKLLFSNH